MPSLSRLGVALGAAALSITLAACGQSATLPAAAASRSMAGMPSVDASHNAADVTFVQDMIAHHRGAIDMATLAPTRASAPQVKDLATRIEAAQAPEIEEMSSWLAAWGASPGADSSMPGMDHGPSPMTSGPTGSGAMGMMTAEQMTALASAAGPAFDRMFLQLMTTHHQGAIAMARTEQASGSNPQAIALARSIETSQTAQVSEMQGLLQKL